jgi:trimeric autotransporter adhesin
MKTIPLKSLFTLILLTLITNTLYITPARALAPLYVAPNVTGNCSSWADACNLQNAIATADSGDEIWVMTGTYLPHVSDRTVSFQLKNGVTIYGGFDGSEAARDNRDWIANPTILSGDLLGNDNDNVAHDEPTRAENSYHVVVGSNTDNTAVLDGFTIAGGNANDIFFQIMQAAECSTPTAALR